MEGGSGEASKGKIREKITGEGGGALQGQGGETSAAPDLSCKLT